MAIRDDAANELIRKASEIVGGDKDATIHIATRPIVGVVDFKWDYAALVEDTTTDTWTFKTGGVGGTTAGVLVITYTDSGKGTIDNVTRTS